MKQYEEYIKMNTRQKQIPITKQSSTLNSSELKYMFPWTLYDDISYKDIGHKTQKIEKKEKNTERKI